MKVAKTIKAKILNYTKYLNDTLYIYQDAVLYISYVVNEEWATLKDLTQKQKLTLIEGLIHKTKKNPHPKYNVFDMLFYKFPSYLRRAAINEACGIVNSHRSNLKNWEETKAKLESKGKNIKGKRPSIPIKIYSFPVFYKKQMFKKWSKDKTTCLIKIFKNNDWTWLELKLNTKNFKERDLKNYNMLSPTLVKSGKKYYIHFIYDKNVKLNNTPIEDKIAISVDLGLTNTAVCSAINSKGTVLDRLFINQSKEKDLLKRKINKLAKATRQSSIYSSKPNYWRKIKGLQTFITQDTANQIIDFAIKNNADVIVFEYLSNFKNPKGFYGAKKFRAKLQHWAKVKIINKTTDKAHKNGIRVSVVNPRNTSALAFDGSGRVKRNNKKDLCTFSTGKKYHSDLNASYNIASRYFIREFLNPLSEKKRSGLVAKVPQLQNRTNCVLATLISLNEVLAA